MDVDTANDRRTIDDAIEAQARTKQQLSKQQKRVLEELRTGAKNTGHFARLQPAILRASERVRELNAMGYYIVNLQPLGKMANYKLRTEAK